MQFQSGNFVTSIMDEKSTSPSDYETPMNAYDEAFTPDRQPRTHWEPLLRTMGDLTNEEMQDRQRRAQRILREDGATYNLTSDPLTPSVWSLDLIPNIIPTDEWLGIEQGLAQRSTLFDLILKDLYGPQKLLKSGIIPSEIIFSHPGFLRQCHGVTVPGAHQLLLHAVDLVRDSSGQFQAIGDRTQAPNGAGYALENRTVVSRVIPNSFRESQVRRLASFFQSFKNMLSNLSCEWTDTPRIVMLTPGAFSSTYFEQAYLSNYLGFPLVQGSDLTVRNGAVWMKSLNGLARVDVILRRVEDAYCDQAELKADSFLGVPGLLEVVRAGNVVLANPLGSGILEAPALMKFLPAMSDFLIGEQLTLPSVASWWCGDKEDLAYVIANINNLIIKPAIRRHDSNSVYGHTLTKEQKASTIESIKKRPHLYVAQSYIPGSMAPIWLDDRMQARPSLLRAFTVANPTGYTVMPGGLSRAGESEKETIVSNISTSKSKDTWILAAEPEQQTNTITEHILLQDEALQANLPSRVVENLFWMGRYAERAEISLRLLRTIFKQMNGVDPLPEESLRTLLEMASIQTGCLPGFVDANEELLANPEDELVSIITDNSRAGSIKANLQAMLSCGEQVKEMLSADTRIIINELRDHIHDLDRSYTNGLPSAPEESLDSLVTSLLALSGLNHESMLRGLDWTFQEIGRRTERALQTAKLLRSALTKQLSPVPQQQILESVLLSVEALISFRRRYRNRARVAYGLDLLMIDGTNPRSLLYQVEQLRKCIKKLPRNQMATAGLSPENKIIIKSLNDIQLADLEELAKVNEKTQSRESLTLLMTELLEQLEHFTVLISDKYFDHTDGPQSLMKVIGKTNL
ncbi:circularly permuted type 2 ATP-grasp protein [Marinomonas colpomeniae]|uniref:Circularly permuted type 2 ATP-grasp protein n=1 Tax=Marinomonas colpomeniae TaxID=2774408 RepID=A0ABR8NUD2_9GAMM|nr:circularly permuted type 2 ATP-grasp protein [Marinomonas colpomeniae]MBD5769661.1 circularly permuted type 2 ATP-grasp protein [Marinomonas colpomeniae]